MPTIQKHGLFQVTDIDNNPNLDTMPTSASVVGYKPSTGNQIYYNSTTDIWTEITDQRITGSIKIIGDIEADNYKNNPNSQLKIIGTSGIFTTGSLNISGSRSNLGTEQTSVLIDGDIFVSGGIGLNDYLQLKPVGSLRIPTNTTASYIYTSGSTNDMYFTQYDGSYTNTTRLRWLESGLSTGLLKGGVLSTAAGATTFSITSGEGIIVTFNATTTSYT